MVDEYHHSARIKQLVQTYDFKDSNQYKGVYDIQMMYKDITKSELKSIELREYKVT